MIRRRRSLTLAQGWSAATTLGILPNDELTCKGSLREEPFQGCTRFGGCDPRVVANAPTLG